jgi:hypothetical protein
MLVALERALQLLQTSCYGDQMSRSARKFYSFSQADETLPSQDLQSMVPRYGVVTVGRGLALQLIVSWNFWDPSASPRIKRRMLGPSLSASHSPYIITDMRSDSTQPG